MENYTYYIKKFKIALAIFGLTLVVLIMIIAQIVPQIQKTIDLQNQTTKKTKSLADLERKLENLKKEAEKKDKIEETTLKVFFKPITDSTDTETAITDEFEEILQIMRSNKIKARSVKYESDPQDDSFVKSASNKYQVCKITAEMIASYSDFENFLRDLYKHEHFLDITKFEIVPYQKNKKILLVSLQLKLYAQREHVLQTSTPKPTQNVSDEQPASQEPATENQAAPVEEVPEDF